MKRRQLKGWQQNTKHSLDILQNSKGGRRLCAKVRKTSHPFIFWRLHPPQCIGLVKYLFPQCPARRCRSINSRCADRQKKAAGCSTGSDAWLLIIMGTIVEGWRRGGGVTESTVLKLCSTRPKVNTVKTKLCGLCPLDWHEYWHGALAATSQSGIVPEVEVLVWRWGQTWCDQACFMTDTGDLWFQHSFRFICTCEEDSLLAVYTFIHHN